MSRPTFLAWFVEALACAGVSVFAWERGVPQKIYAIDMSMMTSVIAALFVGTVIWIGWQAWAIDSAPRYLGLDASGRRIDGRDKVSSRWGHTAERLAVICGFVGTAGGVALQMQTMATAGIASLAYLGTSLFTTMSGGVAAGLIAIMTYSLEQGIERHRR